MVSFVYGQETVNQEEQSAASKNIVFSAGLLMGGGSLIGVDLEFVIPTTCLGIQIGGGINGYGAGINYHLTSKPNSSFISLQYWNQGFGDNHYASYLGPMFVFRAKKLFQAGLGIGSVVKKGPRWESTVKDEKVNMALLYNIGIYF